MINKLIAKIQKMNAPIVVGLDPMMKFVPEHIRNAAFAEHGETLEGAAEAIWQYNKGIVDAICDLVPAVKPQIAMYEQFGLPGLTAFKKTVDYCREKDLVVIGDVKRGDIGSTSEAYAVGHLGKVQTGDSRHYGFNEDFVTVNPYLGSDGVNPFLKVCDEEKKGIFVLVKTSNPSSGELQDRMVKDGPDGEKPLYEIVGGMVAAWAREHMPETGNYSYVGAVVGATYRSRDGSCGKSCPVPSSWCPAMARRAAGARIWCTSSTGTGLVPSSIPPGASSRLTSRSSTPATAASAMRMPPGRQCWPCGRTSALRWGAAEGYRIPTRKGRRGLCAGYKRHSTDISIACSPFLPQRYSYGPGVSRKSPTWCTSMKQGWAATHGVWRITG